MLTAGTLRKAPLFNTPQKLDLVRAVTFELAAAYSHSLHAWAFFRNHYHLIASFENAQAPHRLFLRHLHREMAVRLNELDQSAGRKVMCNFWDTELTFEKSYLARLNYVHQNAVHHGLAPVACDYPWCSSPWFETNARPAFMKSVYSFKTDRLNVPDEF